MTKPFIEHGVIHIERNFISHKVPGRFQPHIHSVCQNNIGSLTYGNYIPKVVVIDPLNNEMN